jgi:hypothetical protein
MSNAVQHPNATLVQVASVFQADPAQPAHPHFRLCIWDDGESMVRTLGAALDVPNAKVRAPGWHSAWHDYIRTHVYEVSPEGTEELVDEYRFDQKLDPVRGTADDRLLLSCFSPGVTSAFAKPIRAVHGFQSEPAAPAAGMGLYTLLRTMVDRYHGRITVRTSGLLLRLTAARGYRHSAPDARYEAEIYKRPRQEAPFLGNLLTMTIPATRQ